MDSCMHAASTAKNHTCTVRKRNGEDATNKQASSLSQSLSFHDVSLVSVELYTMYTCGFK